MLKGRVKRALSKLITITMFACVISAATAEEEKLELASYLYKKHDRVAALTPLSKLMASITGQQVKIALASSPTELAEWMASGKSAVAVPNLIGYLEMRRLGASVAAIAVPEKLVNPNKPGYTSSVIFHPSTGEQKFESLMTARQKPSFFVVWPDSASGGLVGNAWLNQAHPLIMQELVASSQGSHDAVLTSVAQTPNSFGVLATNVFLNADASKASEHVIEVWRSDEIPYGPLVCHINAKTLCQMLADRLNNESAQSRQVLTGLISGWPEFNGSERFIAVDESTYLPLAQTYSASKQ